MATTRKMLQMLQPPPPLKCFPNICPPRSRTWCRASCKTACATYRKEWLLRARINPTSRPLQRPCTIWRPWAKAYHCQACPLPPGRPVPRFSTTVSRQKSRPRSYTVYKMVSFSIFPKYLRKICTAKPL